MANLQDPQGNLQDVQDVNLEEDEDEMFQKPKMKRSDFRTMDWSHQMYAIQRYLDFRVYPHFMVGSGHKEKKRDFHHIVKKCYVFDKETYRLMKLVKQKKLNRTGSWQSKKSPHTCNHNNFN